MNSNDTHNVTSSQELQDGHSPYNSRTGQQIDLFGREVAHASLSVLPDDKKVKMTKGTYGQYGCASLRSVNLQQSMESKLRAQLPTGGLTMFMKGWRHLTTPSGRLYFQLVQSVRPIKEIDYGLWPTPRSSAAMCESAENILNRGTRNSRLEEDVAFSMWPTPNASDHRDRGSYDNPCVQRRIEKGKQVGLTMLAQGTGKMESGLTVQTESKGSLNPQFVSWLMGFRTASLSSMLSAMQSYRKSRQKS
jgi:hypothetical protein